MLSAYLKPTSPLQLFALILRLSALVPYLHSLLQVWSTQVFQFRDYPEDGPGALRICCNEELNDQLIFFGLIPVGVYAIRSDPGTPLHLMLSWLRDLVGRWLVWNCRMWEVILQVVGIEVEPAE
jgi:hypothetical protein